MVESARMARWLDFLQRIGLTGFRRNSQGEVTSSGGSEHVGKGEALLLTEPGGRVGDESLCNGELLDEPEDHQRLGSGKNLAFRLLEAFRNTPHLVDYGLNGSSKS